MKKNLYYQKVVKRQNLLGNFLSNAFINLSSYPRLLIEVFIRKNFGERYFSLISAVTIAVVLGFLPSLIALVSDTSTLIAESDDFGREDLLPTHRPGNPYLAWYIYLGLFLLVSLYRHVETLRNPSVFDFARYSRFKGEINPVFFKVKIPGIQTNIRLIETLLEPLPFLLLGIVLWLLGQNLGILLTLSSLIYSFGYIATYNAGDNFVMDKIDEIICNEELKKSFVDGLGEDQTRGFSFAGRRPADESRRKQILPLMTETGDDVFVAN